MIFISYAREDRRQVRELALRLADAGIAVHIDPTSSESDPFWREGIRSHLSRATVLVAFESVAAQASPWVDQERRAFGGPVLSVGDGTCGERPYASVWVHAEDLVTTLRALGASSNGRRRPRPPDDSEAYSRRTHSIAAADRWLGGLRTGRGDHPVPIAAERGGVATTRDGTRLRALESDPSTFVAVAPVTNGQYAAYVADAGVVPPPTWQRAEHRQHDAPVTGVTWFEAAAYAEWAGGSLPNEKEWEAAALATPGAEYATNNGRISPDLAWFDRRFGEGAPKPSRAFPPNGLGFFGMCGNTWDWVADAWGSHRVLRGGGYGDSARFCRISSRYRNAPIDRDCTVGFRIKVRPESNV